MSEINSHFASRIAPLFCLASALVVLCGGCASESKGPTTQPAIMSVPAEQATADYWFKQPPVASVTNADFGRLWQACQDTVIFDQFEIDEEDERLGVMTTFPMISKQFFEVWRSDAGDANEVAESSLQTIRRIVRFDFVRNADGEYVVYPRVLKEQMSHPERRITAQAQFNQAFASNYEAPTRLNEQGATVPNRYWYAVGRDYAMEGQLARAVGQRAFQKPEARNSNDESNSKSE